MTQSAITQRLTNCLPWKKRSPVPSLGERFSRQTGKPSAKWAGYLPHYERWLSGLKNKPIALLEIGVQAGGSLEIWAEYFEHAAHIIGCDVDPRCGELPYEDPRIKVLVGDINDRQLLVNLHSIAPKLDVVIDDGSHRSADIIQSFLSLFPTLSDDGLYVVEDLHCSYWQNDYGGGLYHPASAMSFFKKIVDIINRPSWGVEIDTMAFLDPFRPIVDRIQAGVDWSLLTEIHRIEFVNSMCLIQKKPAPQNALGPLILSGARTADEPSAYQYVGGELTVPEQTGNIFSRPDPWQPGRDHRLISAVEEIGKLQQSNLELTTQFYESTKNFYDASVKIQQLEEVIRQLHEQLESAQNHPPEQSQSGH